jgi:hypothetical protein
MYKINSHRLSPSIVLVSAVALGHSSINVSLTYLRGLEIAELKEEDMPMV